MHVRIRHGSIAAAALLISASLVSAQPFVEDFEGLTQVAPDVLGTSSLPGATILDEFGSAFGVPDAILGEAGISPAPNTHFPYGDPGDDQWLRWTEATDQYVQYNMIANPLAGTGPTTQIAFAMRLQLDPVTANNDIDVMFISGTGAGQYNLFGLVSVAGTLFRMATTNNFGGVTLSTTAFDPTAPSDPDPLAPGTNWGDGKWRVLIGSITPDTVNGSAKWWVMDPDDGDMVLLVDASGIANDRVGSDVDYLGLGASLDIGGSSTDCVLDMDEISFYPITDPNYDTEAEFLAAVQADMSGFAPPLMNGDADADGDVDVADATLVYNVASGVELPAAITGDGDVDGASGITAADGDAIVQFVVNGTPFPI